VGLSDPNPYQPLSELSDPLAQNFAPSSLKVQSALREKPPIEDGLCKRHRYAFSAEVPPPQVIIPIVDRSHSVSTAFTVKRPVVGAHSVLRFIRALDMQESCRLTQLLPAISAKCSPSRPVSIVPSRTSVNPSRFPDLSEVQIAELESLTTHFDAKSSDNQAGSLGIADSLF